MRSAHKYASLTVRSEPMGPDDKKFIRLKTLLAMAGSGIASFLLAIMVFYSVRTTIFTAFGKYEAFRHKNGWLFVVFGAVFAAAFIAALLYMISRFYRAYLEQTLKYKIIFSGSVTGKRFTGRGSTRLDNGYHASLDGIEFTLYRDEYQALHDTGHAEFHCTFPGDVFRVINLSDQEHKKAHKLSKKEVLSDDIVNAESRRQYFRRVLQMTGTASISMLFTISSAGIWWFSGNPSGAFMFKSRQVTMQISESRMQLIKKKSDQLYETMVKVSYPQSAENNSDLTEKKIPRKFNLEARPNADKILNKENAQQELIKYPKGKLISVYAADLINGPFFTIRNTRFTIISAFLIIFTFFSVNGAAAYFLFYRNRR